MIATAAAIVHELTAAGMTSGQVHRWFDAARSELGGMSPHDALRLVGAPAQNLILALARDDAEEARDAERAYRRAA